MALLLQCTKKALTSRFAAPIIAFVQRTIFVEFSASYADSSKSIRRVANPSANSTNSNVYCEGSEATKQHRRPHRFLEFHTHTLPLHFERSSHERI
jgi:hypothetical protein